MPKSDDVQEKEELEDLGLSEPSFEEFYKRKSRSASYQEHSRYSEKYKSDIRENYSQIKAVEAVMTPQKNVEWYNDWGSGFGKFAMVACVIIFGVAFYYFNEAQRVKMEFLESRNCLIRVDGEIIVAKYRPECNF